MLTGSDLGAAIEVARIKKNVPKNALAKVFGISAPSVNGWVATGRIDKSKLIEVIRYFSDVVGPEHWGLTAEDADVLQIVSPTESAESQAGSAADAVLKMLAKHGKSLTDEARQKIAAAVAETNTAPATAESSNVIVADFSRRPIVGDGDILVPQYDIRGSLGHGQVPAEYVEFVRNIVVDASELEKTGVEFTSHANLQLITGWGQSMRGTINDKDPLFIDRGVTSYVGEGVYFFTWLNHMYIKRVQVLDAEHFLLVSDNKEFEAMKARMDEVFFHAKAVIVWNVKRL